ncbi:unnamed protein product [Phaeothamnion confervicola]
MTAAEVLAALTYIEAGTSPRRALEAAIAIPGELTGRLVEELSLAPLDILERHESAPGDTSAYYLQEIAMHLLAAWCDPRGWHLVLDFYVSDCDLATALADIGTEAYLPAILIRCYDGSDLRGFERIIDTPSLDPLFRQACVQAYHGLVLKGRVPRIRMLSFLARMLQVPAGAAPDQWYGWLALRAAELQEPALRPAIGALIDRGLTAPPDDPACAVSHDDIDAVYATPRQSIADSLLADEHFEDLPASIAEWDWFSPSGTPERPATLPWSPDAALKRDD